MSPLIVFEFE